MSSRPRGRGRGGFRGGYRGRGGGDWESSPRGGGRGRGGYDSYRGGRSDEYHGGRDGRSDDHYRGGRGRGRGGDGYRGRSSGGYRGRSDGFRRGSDNYRGRSENYRGRSDSYRGRSEHYGGREEHYSERSDYRSKRGSSSRRYDDSPPRHREGSYRRSSPNPEKLIASLGVDAEEALTAIISKVIKKSSRDGRGREDREGSHKYKEGKERRDYYREDSRERGSRQFDEGSGGRGSHHHKDDEGDYHRGSSRYPSKYQSGGGSAPPPKRRTSLHGEQPYKRQRVDKDDDGEHEKSPSKERSRSREGGMDREGSRSPDREKSSEREGERRRITLTPDGERDGNGEEYKPGGRYNVELRCPHCPNQRSITFNEYKYHQISENHKSQLSRLARKHSVVLRKIRIQQRQEQKDIEAGWRDDKPEEFKKAMTRFCSTCKLAFKCIGTRDVINEGINLHNSSKLHRMQRHYLHPRCGVCRMTFQSRMLYEYHICSIGHMRARAANKEHGDKDNDDENGEGEEGDDLDLNNFMTVDSVGDDDESVGSEHDEITGGMKAEEAADKAAHDEDEYDEGHKRSRGKAESSDRRSDRDRNGSGRRYRRGRDADLDFEDEDEEDEEAPFEMDWSKEQEQEQEQLMEDDDENEGQETLGTKYVRRIEAYFCGLCYKIIRADRSSSGSGNRALTRHCRSSQHIDQYYALHPQQEKVKSEPQDEGDEAENEEKEEKSKDEGDNKRGSRRKVKRDVYDKHGGDHYEDEDEEEHYEEEEDYENEGGEEEEEAAAEGHEEDQNYEQEDEEYEHEEVKEENEEVKEENAEEEDEHTEKKEQAEEIEDDSDKNAIWEAVDQGLTEGDDVSEEVAENGSKKVLENEDTDDTQDGKKDGESKAGNEHRSPEKKDEDWFEVGDDVNIE